MIEGGVQPAGGLSKVNWQNRIVIDPEIHHGTPCVRGTRVPVSVVLGSLAQGLTPEQVLQEYPTLGEDEIRACLAYAVEMIQSGELLISLD